VAEPTLYLFDGFNLLHAGEFGSTDELRDLLASWVAGKGARGVLVFDGHGADEEHGPLVVRWAPDADALIERLAAENRRSEQVAVVSEVRKLSSRTFLGELARPEHLDRTRGDLRDKLDAETLARLEKLRRGE
jgi:predicted RNA-binding protein with PIN domain